jgi:hypothetical protein
MDRISPLHSLSSTHPFSLGCVSTPTRFAESSSDLEGRHAIVDTAASRYGACYNEGGGGARVDMAMELAFTPTGIKLISLAQRQDGYELFISQFY